MTKTQIIAALTESAKPGTMLELITHLANSGTDDTRIEAEDECVRLWIKAGGSAPEAE